MKRFKKIYVEITNICNLNCSFCSNDKKKKREMSLNEFEIILKRIEDYTDYIYLHVKGEPLLHSNLKEILTLCKKHNIKVNITTNGILLKNRLDLLLESDIVRQVNISLQSYEQLQGDEYIDNILYSTLELSKKGIYTVLRFWALEENNFSKANIYLIKKIESFFNISILDKIKNRNNISLGNNIYINKASLFNWPNIENNIDCKFGKCLGLKSHIGILSDGTVIPCCLDSSGIINLGNIFEKDLSKILNTYKVKNIITNFNNNKKVEKLCMHCDFYK